MTHTNIIASPSPARLARGLVMLAVALTTTSCAEQRAETRAEEPALDVVTAEEFAREHRDFDSYWFRGLAELTRYELEQSRYGDTHPGDAVLIFVTEPFLPGRQVKHEFGPGPDLPVLKLNHYRRFYTGVYPYTLMTSTFTPARGDAPTLKLTSTVQEWCGQAFTQLNRREEGGWDAASFSYFQAEGDRRFELSEAPLEDELMSLIRRDPGDLPEGELTMVPAFHYLRLMHQPAEPVAARATLSPPRPTEFGDEPLRVYEVAYPSLKRTLTIYFEPDFPHGIAGWTEAYPGFDGEEMEVTVARRTKSIMLDYWAKHGADDARWRDALGLEW